MDGFSDMTPSLFPSLLRALGASAPAGNAIATEAGLPTDDAVRQELLEWHRSCPLCAGGKDRYAQFYRRIADALCQLQQQPGAQLISGELGDEDAIAEWIEADWPRDEGVLQCDDATASDAFVVAVHSIASCLVDSTADRSDAQKILSATRKLRGLCSDDSGGEPQVKQKKPMTMAEKLAHMRSQRTALVIAKEASTRNVAPVSQGATAIEVDSLPLGTASSASTDSLRGDEDHTAHYFTIETRHDLKERLSALQERLDELLLQTKLAWMKCFAHPSGDNENSLDNHDSDERVAAQLVTQGETLACHLLDAFQKARQTTCPINDYKALVAACEAEFDAFQTLVNATAAAPSPVRTKPPQHEPDETTAPDSRLTAPVVKPRPAAFDLPSMKAYYERAAPSYTAYLPQKKR